MYTYPLIWTRIQTPFQKDFQDGKMTLTQSKRDRGKKIYVKKKTYKTNNKQFWLDSWIDESEMYAIIIYTYFFSAVTVIVVDAVIATAAVAAADDGDLSVTLHLRFHAAHF